MLLSQLNGYFARHKRACLADLAAHFDVPPQALRGMLDLLIAKGRISRVQTGLNCAGCSKCDPQQLEIYERRSH
ncbi:MAG TPA: sugar metabolism transcriptional regulator [Rhizobiales bacterium]|nr:sugar metabolism transcriptional regulator [Hyphomicrobiales bacterium]